MIFRYFIRRRNDSLRLGRIYRYSTYYIDFISPPSSDQQDSKKSQIEEQSLTDKYRDRRAHQIQGELAKFSQQRVNDYHRRYDKPNVDFRAQWSQNDTTPTRVSNVSQYRYGGSYMNYQTYSNIAKLLAKEQFPPENQSVDVLPILPIISMQFNDEINFSRNCLHNWWQALQQNLQNVKTTELSKAVIGLEKMNLRTNGQVLKIISWDDVQQLACVFLSDVDNNVSKMSFHYLLAALADFVVIHKQIPSNYLKKSLSDGVQMYFQSERYQNYLRTINSCVGFILEKMILINIKVPSSECLKTIIFSCWIAANYNYSKPTGDQLVFLLINLNKIIEAFLTWNIDGDEYHHEMFWISMFASVKHLINNIGFGPKNSCSLYVEIFKNILLATSKFDKVQQFKTTEQFWLEKLVQIVSMFKFRQLSVNAKNDLKLIEMTIENEDFESFRPVLTKFGKFI